ncbi:MAG TPA: hypothetical protein VMT20_18250 [Terriglobia bacterium]|nr:hypothetical protein [Terriglobia bacterium]
MQALKTVVPLLGGSVLALSLVTWANAPGAGEIIRASNTTLNGVAVPEVGTVTPGSVLATGDNGSALVQFSPDTQVNLLARTSVTFRSDLGRLSAEMSSGTVGAKSLGQAPLLVETSSYQIRPAGQSGAIYVVAILPDLTTVVSARRGSVSILQKSSGEEYALSEGHYVKLAGDPQSIPPQTSQNSPSSRPAGLLRPPGKAFVIAVGAGVGLAVILDETLEPSPVSPSAP